MYEPKFKLNKKDEARFNELVVRHVLESAKKRYLNFPPLTREENLEMERLQKKREKKGNAHPKAQAALRCQREHDQKMKKMLRTILTSAGAIKARNRKLEPIIRRLNINVDSKK